MNQVLIDRGALRMALNVLRRAGKDEVADEVVNAVREVPLPATPSSKWKEQGEPDPHGTAYDCERAALCMGYLTDDELANAVFLNYVIRPNLQDIIDGKAHSPFAYVTAAKERIRWLSRALERALKDSTRLDWFQENIVEHKPGGYDGCAFGRFDIWWKSETNDLRDAIDLARSKESDNG